jgi:hypothetical protein
VRFKWSDSCGLVSSPAKLTSRFSHVANKIVKEEGMVALHALRGLHLPYNRSHFCSRLCAL